ncbi:hypothetical protein KCP70_25405 [Salmonella enterica subsp. enterica]|nr:hypothetical protein KCP70_25405 [Salmonella enterica subsp. enterica]
MRVANTKRSRTEVGRWRTLAARTPAPASAPNRRNRLTARTAPAGIPQARCRLNRPAT